MKRFSRIHLLHSTSLAAALVLAAASQVSSSSASAQAITPTDIPASFGIGTDGSNIQGWIDNHQMGLIRQHGWTIWAGLNASSGQSFKGASLPIWETWLGNDEVFTSLSSPTATSARTLTQPSRAFIIPHQHSHLLRLRQQPGSPPVSPSAADSQVVAFNKFNPSAASFIMTPQTVPGVSGGPFAINSQAGLTALNAAWASNTPTVNRSINDFPINALELKPVMGVVAATGVTQLPIWQGLGSNTNDQANPSPNHWTNCVLVTPSQTGTLVPLTAKQSAAALKNKPKQLACKKYLYSLPVSMLYNFVMSAGEAQAMTNAQSVPAQAGDFAVLLAMHVNSKEVPFWTWQTFYWQPGTDTPNGFPGSKSDAPSSLPAPFNNYAMCTAYKQSVPATAGTKMAVCFNPYLETSSQIPAGISSNCLSCHGVAGVTSAAAGAGYPPNYLTPVNFFNDLTYFTTTFTRTDFSWAVASPP